MAAVRTKRRYRGLYRAQAQRLAVVINEFLNRNSGRPADFTLLSPSYVAQAEGVRNYIIAHIDDTYDVPVS